MRSEVQNNRTAHANLSRCALAILMALCLLLGQFNGGISVAYAAGGNSVTFQVGTGITAELTDGVLTLSGTGDTHDFTAETAPFLDYETEIRSLVIEEGITYLGAYLFSGLGELGGELTLPASIVGFGESAFCGESFEASPHFTTVRNLFESGEVVRAQTGQDGGYAVEHVLQQDIAHPETLFCQGQTGTATCTRDNASFLQAVRLAGYQIEAAADDAQVVEVLTEPSAQKDEPVAAEEALVPTGDTVTVYVDQANGDDANIGTSESPKQTLAGAAAVLKTSSVGGTVETNRIVIQGTYTRASSERNLPAVPFTLAGADGAVFQTLDAEDAGVADHPLYLGADFCLENITTQKIDHIYGNGYNLTIGDNVNTKTALYLYGHGQNALNTPSSQANVTVKSGHVLRIVGYVRSKTTLDCADAASTITVEGTARVDMIVAGSASGEIQNANVTINVKDAGHVDTLVGGNQGFNEHPSPFSGRTAIHVSGGSVDNLYGAGLGRNSSVPTYRGDLNIDVTGGKVGNLYGAGSAAYVISGEGEPSRVGISVSTGGQVESLFATGRGWQINLPSSGSFAGGVNVDDFGSLTGEVGIDIKEGSTVGNVYASGQGYSGVPHSGTKKNAYLNGTARIQMTGGTVTGNIYGGGKGIADAGYEECARVTEGSDVQITVAGGTVNGNVYGGGQIANVKGSTSVTLSGGTVQGNVYGGGEKGEVKGATVVNIVNGTVHGSVYGGALGIPRDVLVSGGSTVNMTGGWVRGNLYGGSELSDDGDALSSGATTPDLIFANLVGGTVSGNVFGGGYQGTVNGSTHLHIGTGALNACKYYASHPDKMPQLTASALSVGGSVYAGGDFGGDGTNYDAITVKGTSHVYLDGTGYETGADGAGGTAFSMTLGGGVFGSGASCDAGLTRLVTLKNYGKEVVGTDGVVTGATRSLAAIQRADRVLLINSHVQLTGQSDVANTDQTALYSLNRIGNHENVDVGDPGNGLVLQGGSTLVLEWPAMELAALRSVDAEGNETGVDNPLNALMLDTGTLLRVSYTDKAKDELYGPVKGYTCLLAGKSAEGYVYARIAPSEAVLLGGEQDGGFVGQDGKMLDYTKVTDITSPYRYWKVKGVGGANVTRQTVLTARTLDSSDEGYGNDDFSVAKGVIELPPADKDSIYTVKSIEVSNTSLVLAEAAKAGQGIDAAWKTSADNAANGGEAVTLDEQKTAIKSNPSSTFGLFMKTGSGFTNVTTDPGKIVSARSMESNHQNTVIGAHTDGGVTGDHVVPEIEFYLTYYNDGITASQDLGTVEVVLERTVDGVAQETTTAKVQIVTRTKNLSNLGVDLYATQAGSYTAKLYIPAGASRELTLTGVKTENGVALVKEEETLSGNNFSVSLQAVKNQGWKTAGLMDAPCDLGAFAANVPIGTTDSRYEAPLEFTLKNAEGFSSKNTPDVVTLTLKDASSGSEVPVTLRVHWEESAVASIKAGPGRQYEALLSKDSLAISQRSAMTTVFTLSAKPIVARETWIELVHAKDSTSTVLPVGTELTLIGGAGFYRYTSTGLDTQITLTDFVSMGNNTSNLSGNLSDKVTVIVDFGPTASGLTVDEYSLRLRNQGTADSGGANFTVNNTSAVATLAGGDGLSRGTHTFQLSLVAGSDTRFADGAAVVLAPGTGESFPEGTVFTFGNQTYYPSGGKVYLPLAGGGLWDITMDTSATAGLPEGSRTLVAQVFPTGASAGNATALRAETTYTVGKNPSYGLSVSLDSDASRIVVPGSKLSFTANYTASADGVIAVSAQGKKADKTYEDALDWAVSGNVSLTAGSGTQTIIVTVPESLDPGTYRLVFNLEGQEVPYNLIVAE